MFSLFRRKPKYTGQQILEQLGESAMGIVSAVAESSDLMIGLKGAATVAMIIRESDRCFGISIKEGTVFERFALAIQDEDLATMTEMTKEMANALEQADGQLQRGGLIHFWFNGYNWSGLND
ncbi:MAG: hypothetical protein A3F73_06185 [Gallionellales bacterium RIFCSPLOWO2_12_FULL_59_22]|nr:MAG: hypothetical protein A3H99_03345 [Gallionellales bacterium RIFCSPLOWO2_02_FULL_59_110]OGT05313.1 MAG: hypothetical protein A2Z65_02620 [Gallionellales bacterium RIFCSPLOWO2_02_58_13]OGT11029.1 MAG: hypothetical protein A3F73_06185 [Gallionellales bacterium RIFCSPLOWO2_12_FULL_59_22]